MVASKKLTQALVGAAAFSALCSPAAAQNRVYPIPKEKQIAPTETEAAFRVGVTGKMPKSATRSGYCCMVMQIDETGKPDIVDVSYCSDPIFQKPSIRAASMWRYAPAEVDGKPVRDEHHTGLMSFLLTNSKNEIIPDKDGLMTRKFKNRDEREATLCSAEIIS